jgi:hypothetical protein
MTLDTYLNRLFISVVGLAFLTLCYNVPVLAILWLVNFALIIGYEEPCKKLHLNPIKRSPLPPEYYEL